MVARTHNCAGSGRRAGHSLQRWGVGVFLTGPLHPVTNLLGLPDASCTLDSGCCISGDMGRCFELIWLPLGAMRVNRAPLFTGTKPQAARSFPSHSAVRGCLLLSAVLLLALKRHTQVTRACIPTCALSFVLVVLLGMWLCSALRLRLSGGCFFCSILYYCLLVLSIKETQ